MYVTLGSVGFFGGIEYIMCVYMQSLSQARHGQIVLPNIVQQQQVALFKAGNQYMQNTKIKDPFIEES